jgi:hypothetical protein
MSYVRLEPFVKCLGCGTWIAVPPASEPRESPEPDNAPGSNLTFELRDNKGGGRMVLTRRDLGRATPDGRPHALAYAITLEFPGQINATAALATDVSRPLLRFFEDLATLDGDWSEERRLRDGDRQFSITCWSCYRGEICFEVSLGAEFQDPAWTVELSLQIRQADMGLIVEKLRRFFAAASL